MFIGNTITLTEVKAIVHPKMLVSKQFMLPIVFHGIYNILPKVLGHPLLMEGLTTLVISMSTKPNVWAYNDILGNCVLLIL